MNQGTRTHTRRSTRLPHYDYGRAGAYFVTVCVRGRICVLSEVVGEDMQLSKEGEIVQVVWEELPGHYENIELDEFVVMPNHVDGIIWTTESHDTQVRAGHAVHKTTDVRAQHAAPLLSSRKTGFPWSNSPFLQIRRYTQDKPTSSHHWLLILQRGYYEHVIRDDKDLFKHRKYIQENPLKWSLDEYYQEMETLRK